jgi:two-component system chemotaxis response regulator CheY
MAATTILLVDDSAVLRASVRFALTRAGHAVVEAADGQGGLDALAAMGVAGERPGMIITDVNMPRMDGITFVTEVKKTPFRFVPILVLTTESQADKKALGKAAGASGWLVKPFNDTQLLDVVKKFVR